MLSRLFEATFFTLRGVTTFFKFFWFGVIAVTVWLKSLAMVNKWLFVFLLPKIVIVLVGILMTSIPPVVLILISFLPAGAAYGIIFLAFLFSFMQF